jgi:hypothetical protein
MKHKNFEYYLNLASNLVLSLFILLGVTYAVTVGFFNFREGLSLNIFFVFVSLTFALAAFSLFFIDPRFKYNISILIFFTYSTLFISNLILESTLRVKEVKSKRVKTDTRTKLDVVLDLRKTKTRVFPNVAPKLILNSEILIDESREKQAVFPLGGNI